MNNIVGRVVFNSQVTARMNSQELRQFMIDNVWAKFDVSTHENAVIQETLERLVAAEAALAEKDNKIANLKEQYQRIITEVLALDPIPACYRPDGNLEPPWEVIKRMRQEYSSQIAHLKLFNPCGHTGFESAPCDVCGYPDSRKLIAKLKGKIVILKQANSDFAAAALEQPPYKVDLIAEIAHLKENEEGIRRIFAQVLPETECDAHGIPSVEALAGNVVEKIAVLNDEVERLTAGFVFLAGFPRF